MKVRKWIGIALFTGYCVFIVWNTILSRPQTSPHADLRFMWSYREMITGNPNWKADVTQNLQNILFFIPFGFLMPIRDRKAVIPAAACVSIIIEVVQYFGGFGLCELDDVICNTLGAAIGFLIWKETENAKTKKGIL